MRFLILTAALLTTTAGAAPLLGSKDSFMSSAFCKAHVCVHVATVPSGFLDQFHYDIDKRYRVVVWRHPTDVKRLWGPQAAAYAGQVKGVGMVWYGVQDTPFGSEGMLAQLLTLATGKTVPAAMALKLMDSGENDGLTWNRFDLTAESVRLPGANAAILIVTAQVNPFQ